MEFNWSSYGLFRYLYVYRESYYYEHELLSEFQLYELKPKIYRELSLQVRQGMYLFIEN